MQLPNGASLLLWLVLSAVLVATGEALQTNVPVAGWNILAAVLLAAGKAIQVWLDADKANTSATRSVNSPNRLRRWFLG